MGMFYGHNQLKFRYGYLYNWYAVNTGNLAPSGWHVATQAEWLETRTQLGGELLAGAKLKSTRTSPMGHPRWDSPNTSATNEYMFDGYPGGYRHESTGEYELLGKNGLWWTATEYDSTKAYNLIMYYNYAYLGLSFGYGKKAGMLVRCVKNTSDWTEGEKLVDIVGNTYNTVKIGNIVWMSEDLITPKYNNNASISTGYTNSEWGALTSGAYSIINV